RREHSAKPAAPATDLDVLLGAEGRPLRDRPYELAVEHEELECIAFVHERLSRELTGPPRSDRAGIERDGPRSRRFAFGLDADRDAISVHSPARRRRATGHLARLGERQDPTGGVLLDLLDRVKLDRRLPAPHLEPRPRCR